MSGPLVLGIETSCDETGIGIVRGRTLLSNTIASSMDEHARYGGVVPEVAARAHLEALQPSIREGSRRGGGRRSTSSTPSRVTSGPGLAGALMVGVGAAKGLAVSLGKPLYAVNHLVGHIAADILTEGTAPARVPDDRAARLGRPHLAAARAATSTSDVRAARRDHGRRRRRGVRQGRAAALPAVSRRARRSIGRRPSGDPERDPVPARALARRPTWRSTATTSPSPG